MKETTALPPVPSSAGYSGGMDGAGSKEGELGRTKSRGTAASGAFIPPTDEEWMKNQLPPSPPFRNSLYTISYLIFFSIWGTLLRLGIQWITFYPGTPLVTPVAWANFGGSFIMGFLLEDHVTFRELSRSKLYAEKPQNWEDHNDKDELAKQKKLTPLFIGLSVGFCGCLTSFSSFIRDIFLGLSNDLPTPNNHPFDTAPRPTYSAARNGGYSVNAVLAVIITTLALSLGGLIAGGHLADALQAHLPSLPPRLIRKALNPLMVLLGWGCWLGAILLAIFPPSDRWRGEVLFSLVFAPAGCLLRYYASSGLNALVVTFPLGTFAVNMFGVAVEGMAYDVQHVGVGIMGLPGGGRIGCQVLQGVMDGFCGSLTTVSTWVAEMKSLRRKRDGYVYAGVSVLGGLALMVVIMGSVKWTVGFGQTGCETGYTSKVS
jgi:fluoride exporter